MSVLLLSHRACLLHEPGDYHPNARTGCAPC